MSDGGPSGVLAIYTNHPGENRVHFTYFRKLTKYFFFPHLLATCAQPVVKILKIHFSKECSDWKIS